MKAQKRPSPRPVLLLELNESMLKNKVEKRIISQVIEFIRGRSLAVAIDSEMGELAGKINFDHKKRKLRIGEC